MKHAPTEQGWVLPIALMGLAVISALTASAWRHAQNGAEGVGHALQHERSRQSAHAQLQAGESAWRAGAAMPGGVAHRSVLISDGDGSPPRWQLHRFTATGAHGDSRVVLESTWAQALDEQGQVRTDTPPQHGSWREVWP